jgi:hypothetical protein
MHLRLRRQAKGARRRDDRPRLALGGCQKPIETLQAALHRPECFLRVSCLFRERRPPGIITRPRWRQRNVVCN